MVGLSQIVLEFAGHRNEIVRVFIEMGRIT